MAEPEYKTLHRAGLASDGWERFKAVLDEYIGAPLVNNPLVIPAPGQTLTINAAGEAVWTYSATGGSLGDLYASPPAAPDPLNDEFDSGEDDLAARGFQVRYNSGSSLLTATYQGPVNYSIDPRTAMSAGQYRSSLRDGNMLFQGGGASIYHILKPFTLGAAAFAVKMTPSYVNTATATNTGLILLDNNTIPVAVAGQNAITNDLYETTYRLQTFQGTTATLDLNVTTGGPDIRQGTIFYIDWLASGSNVNACQINAGGGAQRFSFRNYALTGTFTPAYAGLYLRNGTTGGPQFHQISYFRKYLSGSWF